MREETIQIFTFEELSDEAKEKARDDYRRDGMVWVWEAEWWNSAQAFSKIAPISIESADYDHGQVSIRWTESEDIADLQGLRAWRWLQNNGWFDWAKKNKAGDCTMTGDCADCSFADDLDKYRIFPQTVPDLKQVFYECAQSWVYAARSDMEYANSDEAIDEMLIANGYEFLSDGCFH